MLFKVNNHEVTSFDCPVTYVYLFPVVTLTTLDSLS